MLVFLYLIGHGSRCNVAQEKIIARTLLLQKYLDHKADLELQSLYALQALVHKLEHPAGTLDIKHIPVLYMQNLCRKVRPLSHLTGYSSHYYMSKLIIAFVLQVYYEEYLTASTTRTSFQKMHSTSGSKTMTQRSR